MTGATREACLIAACLASSNRRNSGFVRPIAIVPLAGPTCFLSAHRDIKNTVSAAFTVTTGKR
jgi:hypothetical protein